MQLKTIIAALSVGAALATGIFLAGDSVGAGRVQAQWDKAKADARIASSQQAAEKAQTTTEVVTRYVDRVRIVRERGETITKEVFVHVPQTQPNPDACVLERNGWRLLHDAAARGQSNDASPRDTDAPGPSAQDTARTVTDNYAQYHAVADQLHALQNWVKGVCK